MLFSFFFSSEIQANNNRTVNQSTTKKVKKLKKKVSKPISKKKASSEDSDTGKDTFKIKRLNDYKNKNKTLIIMIDPGHGGMDPGAVVEGIREKDILFKLSQRIKKVFDGMDIREQYKIETTRSRDVYLSLKSRRVAAEKKNADLFISLHLNLSPLNSSAAGIEIYFVTEEAANGEELKNLVHYENSADSDNDEITEFEKTDDAVYIFADLQKRSTINKSIQLALNMEKALSKLTETRVRHIKRAPFQVLKNLNIPSILIELGFLSNEGDRILFSTDDFIDKIAKQIIEGIIMYEQNTLKKIEYPVTEVIQSPN